MQVVFEFQGSDCMERKRMGRLLAAFVVALVATLGFVLGLSSTARADDATYTIVIINTNTSQAVFETNEGALNKEYTAELFGPEALEFK